MKISVESRKAYDTTLNKIKRYEQEHGKALCSKEEALEYLKSCPPKSLNAVSKELTIIRKAYGIEITIEEVREVVDYKAIYARRYLTEEELLQVCGKLDNSQDAVILIAGFYNLLGAEYSTMRDLTSMDIDMEDSTVRGVKVSRDAMMFFREALIEEDYITASGDSRSLVVSNYLIRPCKTGKQSLNGCDKVSIPVIKARVNRMQSVLNENFTLVTLKNSKVVADAIRANTPLDTLKDVRMFLGRNGIKMNLYEFNLIKEVLIDKGVS